MHIGIFGGTGTIGKRVVAEALLRGHTVTALVRHESRIPIERGRVTWKVADILDAEGVAKVLPGLDVIVNAFGPGPSSNAAGKYPAAAIDDAIAQADSLLIAARALLKALLHRPSLRLIVVGGAATLEVQPGLQAVDCAPIMEAALQAAGLPEAYMAVALAHRDALDIYRTSNRNWSYFAPAAVITPGERSGRFRLGADQLVTDANGQSRISCEDFAMALLDEIELPRFVQRRFTIAY